MNSLFNVLEIKKSGFDDFQPICHSTYFMTLTILNY